MNRYLDDPATQKKVFPVATGFDSDVIYGATPLLGAGGRKPAPLPNPHFWLDPILARRAADNILHRLQEADPAHSAAYATNAARLDAQLVALHADFERDLQPLRSRPFITSHDFFPYLARRYHLNLAGVVEIVPEIDPSLRYITQLAGMIRREKVRVLFVEPYFSSKLANQLCLDLGVRRLELDPVETGPATPSAYLDAMRQNLEHLKEGLRATTP
jgi:zinc/manganese transport system substrate-binding protein